VRQLVDGVERRIEIISKKDIIFASPSDYVDLRPDEFDLLKDRQEQAIRPVVYRNIVKRTNSVDVDFDSAV
jgi:hypothetical protein